MPLAPTLAPLLVLSMLQAQESRPRVDVPASRPASSSIAGVVKWTGEVPDEARRSGTCVVGREGRLAHAVVELKPLEGQDLSQVPPAQVPATEERQSRPVTEGRTVEGPAATETKELNYPERLDAIDRGVDLALLGIPRVQLRGPASFWRLGRAPRPGPQRMLLDMQPFKLAQVMRLTDEKGTVRHIIVEFAQYAYRVTGKDGAFRFEGLQQGAYELVIWHESGRKESRRVVLEQETALKVDVELR